MNSKYAVELTFVRDVLATNPCDPNVMDNHIINKQRQIILEKSKINAEINKYLAALPISEERSKEEIDKLIYRLEKDFGIDIPEDKKAEVLAKGLSALKETVAAQELSGTRIFFWDEKANRPCIGDHMVYGFLKAAAEAVGRSLPTKRGVPLHSISYTQALINQHVRCDEEFITFDKDIRRGEDGKPEYLQRSLRCDTAQGPRVSLAKSEVVPAGAKIKFHLKVLESSPLEESVLRRLFEHGEFFGMGQWRNSGRGMFRFELQKVQG